MEFANELCTAIVKLISINRRGNPLWQPAGQIVQADPSVVLGPILTKMLICIDYDKIKVDIAPSTHLYHGV
jgi:hypothetical protein